MANSIFGHGYKAEESTGGSRKLPAGGYICRIMGARIELSKSSNLPMVVIQFDICEGEYSNFYHDKFNTDKGYRQNEAKYQGIARIPAIDENGNARRGFNSFCGAVEKSNDITLPTEDMAFLNMLKGKVVGIIFGREEVRFDDGRTAMVTKPMFYRSVQAIEDGNYDTPQDKMLQPTAPSIGGTSGGISALFGSQTTPVASEDLTDNFSAAEGEIPFN